MAQEAEREWTDEELAQLERKHSAGITSAELIALVTARGFKFSEATLRKYVQLGLLPRSRRVGRKGMRRGSVGLYPPQIISHVAALQPKRSDRLAAIGDAGRRLGRALHGVELEILDVGVARGVALLDAHAEAQAHAARGAAQDALLEAQAPARAVLEEQIGVVTALGERHFEQALAQAFVDGDGPTGSEWCSVGARSGSA